MSDVAVVTGAARGIGLELTGLLVDRGYTVVACPRRLGGERLESLAAESDRCHVVRMDVGSDASVHEAAEEIGNLVPHLDLLINNAGVYPKDSGLEKLDMREIIRAFDVNTVGPLRVARALLPLLRKGSGKRIMNLTSLMGSITDNGSGGSYAYRMSKTALNMAVRNLAYELSGEGFMTLAIHPGWVQTDMGGPAAPVDLRVGATEVLRVILETGSEHNGGFVGPGGRPLPY